MIRLVRFCSPLVSAFQGRACVVALDSGDESEVLRAVVELSAGKRLFERTIVASLETLLDHESERVRGCVGAVLRARGCSTDGEAVAVTAQDQLFVEACF